MGGDLARSDREGGLVERGGGAEVIEVGGWKEARAADGQKDAAPDQVYNQWSDAVD